MVVVIVVSDRVVGAGGEVAGVEAVGTHGASVLGAGVVGDVLVRARVCCYMC